MAMATIARLVQRKLSDDRGASAGGGLHPDTAAGRAGALLHARQAAALADRDGVDLEAAALIGHLHPQPPVVEDASDGRSVDTGVARHVGEGLLDDTVRSRLHLGPQSPVQAGAPQRDVDASLLAIALHEPDEGWLQPQVVEDGGPEVEGEVVHPPQQLDGEVSGAP